MLGSVKVKRAVPAVVAGIVITPKANVLANVATVKKGEGKPKCLSKSRAASLRAKGGKKAIAAAVRKKRREDPNKNRRGKAKNVSNTTRSKKK